VQVRRNSLPQEIDSDAAAAAIDAIRRRFPNAADHPARVRPARWFVLFMGGVFIGLGVLFANIDVEYKARAASEETRYLISLSIGLIGGVLAVVALLARGTWVASVCDSFAGGSPIEDMLAHDCKADRATGAFLMELVILAALVSLVNLAFWMLDLGKTAIAVATLILVTAWSISLTYRRKFKAASDAEADLAWTVGGIDCEYSDPKSAGRFLRHSFLHSDVALEVKSLWVALKEGHSLAWGRYATGGQTLSSGLFCAIEFVDRPEAISIGEQLAPQSTVYFDERSKTIFGTLKTRDSGTLAVLDGLQWQYLGGTLIGRMDQDLLQSKVRKAGGSADLFIPAIVVAWEKFGAQLCLQQKAR
jgi:hypothetical protein